MEKEKGLAGADLGRFGDYDQVDLFGLDEFGAPVGMGPLYGALIGTGAGTLTAIGVRSLKPEWGGSSELIGLAAAVLAGGAMLAFPGTRHAGWIAMASGAMNNGLRAVEMYFKAVPGSPLGEIRIQRRQALGYPQIERMKQLGQPGPARRQPQLMGPQFNRAAAHWGTSPVLMVPQQ